MVRRVPVCLLLITLAACSLLGLPTAVRAQQDAVVPLQSALERGLELESKRRWGEALSHYEDLRREHPQAADLQERIDTVKIHYGIARRYNDNSYLRWLREMGEADSLALYDEILMKIQSHYVDQSQWQQMIDDGLKATYVALDDAMFSQTHLRDVPPEWINNFRRELRRDAGSTIIRDRSDAVEAVRRAGRLARRHLGLSPTVVVLEFANQAVSTLDDYSTFLTATQLDDLFSQIDGNFVGLGIELKARSGKLQILKVIEGSPAEQGGLRAGDQIVAVNGRDTRGITTEKAASLLQGPENSTVDISIETRDGGTKAVRLRRRAIEVPSIEETKMISAADGIAYFRLTSFQKTTVKELDSALWKMHRLGMKMLVMDLRGNPGGLLTSAVEVADRFVDQGRIVSTRGRSNDQNWSYSAHKTGTWNMPLVVLIDHDSASASEIFAGCMRDHRRAWILGENTYGKGSVQSIFTLSRGDAGLRLTTAKFYSPHGHPFSKVGVAPHIVVHRAAKPTSDGLIAQASDPVIDEAIRLGREKLLQR